MGMTQEIARMKRASAREDSHGGTKGTGCGGTSHGSQKSTPAGSGGVKQPHRLQTRHRGSQRDPEVPEVNGASHQKVTFPAFGP